MSGYVSLFLPQCTDKDVSTNSTGEPKEREFTAVDPKELLVLSLKKRVLGDV